MSASRYKYLCYLPQATRVAAVGRQCYSRPAFFDLWLRTSEALRRAESSAKQLSSG